MNGIYGAAASINQMQQGYFPTPSYTDLTNQVQEGWTGGYFDAPDIEWKVVCKKLPPPPPPPQPPSCCSPPIQVPAENSGQESASIGSGQWELVFTDYCECPKDKTLTETRQVQYVSKSAKVTGEWKWKERMLIDPNTYLVAYGVRIYTYNTESGGVENCIKSSEHKELKDHLLGGQPQGALVLDQLQAYYERMQQEAADSNCTPGPKDELTVWHDIWDLIKNVSGEVIKD
jgi:hypothetical protein